MEEKLLVRFAMCLDPRKPGASGLWRGARRTLGIRVTGLSESEKRIRKALKDEILGTAKVYDRSREAHVIPGLGPHTEFPNAPQIEIEISAHDVHEVAKKVVRGCEYMLANGRIVEPPYEIEVFIPSEMPRELDAHLKFGPDYLGPGCRIRRAVPVDEPGAAIYEIVMWDTWKLAFSILPPETLHVAEPRE